MYILTTYAQIRNMNLKFAPKTLYYNYIIIIFNVESSLFETKI